MPIDQPSQKITTEQAVALIQKYGDRILSWIGIAARRNLAKFNRTVGPVMAGQAIETGLPVFAFWFGQLVLVNTSGQPSVYADNVTSGSQARSILQGLEQSGQSFYLFNCGQGLTLYTAQEIASNCFFEPHGPRAGGTGGFGGMLGGFGDNVGADGGAGAQQGTSFLPIVLIAAAVLYFIRR